MFNKPASSNNKHFSGISSSFTLIELIISIIIAAIIVAFGMPAYQRARCQALYREAESQLQLLHSAERVYDSEISEFIACIDNDDCNTKLGVDLPPDTGSGGNWDYNVVSGTPTVFDAIAVTTANCATTSFHIDETMDLPTP